MWPLALETAMASKGKSHTTSRDLLCYVETVVFLELHR